MVAVTSLASRSASGYMMLTLFLRRVAVMVFQTAESSVKETPCINAASTFEVVNDDEDIDFSYVGTDRQRCDPTLSQTL